MNDTGSHWQGSSDHYTDIGDEMIKLQEGKDYTFIMVRITDLDGVSYFVLEGPDGRRYLLNMERYKGYGIDSGK